MLVLSLVATLATLALPTPLQLRAPQELDAEASGRGAAPAHLDLQTQQGPLRLTAFGQGATTAPSPSSPLGAGSSGSGSFLPLGVGSEGDQPYDVAYALDGRVVVACLRDTNSIEFYDGDSGARLGRVDVPSEPTDIDVVPDGSTVLVTCRSASRVTVVDVATRSIVRIIDVSARPYGVVALNDGVRAVVGCDRPSGSGAFDVIDWTTGTTLRTISTPSQGPIGEVISPWFGVRREILPEFDVTPDDQKIVFASVYSRSIRVYDVATGATLHVEGPLTLRPFRLALSPSGSFCVTSSSELFTTDNSLTLLDLNTFSARDLAVGSDLYLSDVLVLPGEQRVLAGAFGGAIEVDVATGQIVQQLPVGDTQGDIELTHDGAHVLVARAGYSVLDVATLTVQAEIPGRLFPRFAIHPNRKRAATVTPYADELVSVATTSGATSQTRWTAELGEPEEIDAPYALALTPDQRTVVAACPVSRNLAVADVATGALQGTIPLEGASHALAVAADGRQVVASLDEELEVVVADLELGQVLARFTVGGTPSDVFITPDGSTAIVRLQNAGSPSLAFFDLDGAATTPSGSVSVPVFGWFNAELSPDGSIVACVGPGEVTLIDVASRSVRATVPSNPSGVTGFWSSDSTKFGWAVDLFSLDIATIGPGGVTQQRITPLQNDLALGGAFDESLEFVYLLAGGLAEGQKLRVFELATGNQVANLSIPGVQPDWAYYPYWVERIGDQLLTARSEFNAAVTRFRMDGANTELVEQVTFEDDDSYGIAFAHDSGRVLVPVSIRGDGLRAIDWGGSRTTRCTPSAPNSTGVPGALRVTGPLVAGEVPVGLEATSLPRSSFGFFLVSRTPGFFQPANSQGTICLGGTIGRILDSAASTGSAGSLTYE
ncbi:MAG: hypothetical protein AAGB93_23770, partial [Planctomycetota bacterium]